MPQPTATIENLGQAFELVKVMQDDGQDVADRRNDHYRRHLLGELGDIELAAPRTPCLWTRTNSASSCSTDDITREA